MVGCAALAVVARTLYGAQTAAPAAVPKTDDPVSIAASDCTLDKLGSTIPVEKIGEPVRRVYSLLPWARAQGRQAQLLGAALHAAFFDAVDLGKDSGLRRIVEHVGLDWTEARAQLGSAAWQAEFEQNRRAMYAAGLWGVPSYRLLDANGVEQLAAWGQDRLWLVARKIARSGS